MSRATDLALRSRATADAMVLADSIPLTFLRADIIIFGGLAHMVERVVRNDEAKGSIPLISNSFWFLFFFFWLWLWLSSPCRLLGLSAGLVCSTSAAARVADCLGLTAMGPLPHRSIAFVSFAPCWADRQKAEQPRESQRKSEKNIFLLVTRERIELPTFRV